MSKVIFKLDKPNNPKTVIMLVFRYKGKKFVASTGVSIDPKIWNPGKEQAKVAGTAIEQQEAITINKKLAKCEMAFLSAFDYYVSNNIMPTTIQLKDKYIEQIAGGSGPVRSLKVINYIDDLIKDTSSEVSKKAYIKVRNLLKRSPRGAQLEFQDLNLKTLSSIVNAWYSFVSEDTGTQYSRSYLNKNATTLVTVLNKATFEGYNVPADYKSSSWRPIKPHNDYMGNDCILEKEEIEILEKAELEPRLDRIRDLFLLGYYTGQRYSDFIRINKDNIISGRNGDLLQIIQQKTNVKVIIPYSDRIKKIFDKHEGYPPTISSQKFNKALQELCKHLGFDSPIITYRVEGKSDRPIAKKIPKYQLISSHTCRRTFCTHQILDGVPPHMVMKISGHKDLRTLSQYIRFNAENPDSEALLRKYFG
jgi:integrase